MKNRELPSSYNPGSEKNTDYEKWSILRDIDPEQFAKLSQTSLLRLFSNRFGIGVALFLAIGAGVILSTESSSRPDYTDKAGMSADENKQSLSAFSEQALREIIRKKRGTVFQGYVEISKGVNIRTEPRIEVDPPSPNIIRWEDIESLNGVSLKGVDSFIVRDPLTVSGSDPSGLSRSASWLVFEAKVSGIGSFFGRRQLVYISLSQQTADLVQFSSRPENMINPTQIGAIIPKR